MYDYKVDVVLMIFRMRACTRARAMIIKKCLKLVVYHCWTNKSIGVHVCTYRNGVFRLVLMVQTRFKGFQSMLSGCFLRRVRLAVYIRAIALPTKHPFPSEDRTLLYWMLGLSPIMTRSICKVYQGCEWAKHSQKDYIDLFHESLEIDYI